MNNAKIPLGVMVSLLLFGEKTNYARLLFGTLLILLGLGVAQGATKQATA
jgi:hypothetical protein